MIDTDIAFFPNYIKLDLARSHAMILISLLLALHNCTALSFLFKFPRLPCCMTAAVARTFVAGIPTL